MTNDFILISIFISLLVFFGTFLLFLNFAIVKPDQLIPRMTYTTCMEILDEKWCNVMKSYNSTIIIPNNILIWITKQSSIHRPHKVILYFVVSYFGSTCGVGSTTRVCLLISVLFKSVSLSCGYGLWTLYVTNCFDFRNYMMVL